MKMDFPFKQIREKFDNESVEESAVDIRQEIEAFHERMWECYRDQQNK